MLKQLIDVKSNKIFVLQTVGKGTSCPAYVWQTDLHTGTAAVCEPALSLLRTTAIYLYGENSNANNLALRHNCYISHSLGGGRGRGVLVPLHKFHLYF